jgi:hypothetical protein
VLILDDLVVAAVPPLDVLGCSAAATELVMVTVAAVGGLRYDVVALVASVVYGMVDMPDDR